MTETLRERVAIWLASRWHAARASAEVRSAAAALLAVAGVKLVLLILDPSPVFFLGDSEVFLDTALSGWIPTARPWLYGLVIRVLSFRTGSLLPLLLLQTAAGAGVALVAYLVARFGLAVRRGVALAAAVAVALAPQQLIWERGLMTECLAGAAFAAFLGAGVVSVRAGRWRGAVAAALLAVPTVAMRYQLLPAVAVGVAALPLAVLVAPRRFVCPSGERRGRRTASRLLVVLAVFVAGQAGLRHVNGLLRGERSAYQWETGYFLIAAWAPVVEPRDAPDPRVAEVIAAPTLWPLGDRDHVSHQLWADDGLVSRVKALDPSRAVTERWARSTALAAAWRNPLGVAGLALANWGDLFDHGRIGKIVGIERGDRKGSLTPRFLGLLADHFGFAATPDWGHRRTLVRWWHGAALWWYSIVALAPVIGALAWLTAPCGRRPVAAWLALVTAPLIVTAVLFQRPVPRLLHPLEMLVVVLLAVLVDRLLGAVGASRAGGLGVAR